MIIGITGSSGSGKSTICDILKDKYDAKVIDADKIAKQLSKRGTNYVLDIVKAFGKDILDDDGELHLTSKEHEAFLEYFRLCLAADVLEREHLYVRGHADGFAYLKKIGAFKTE